MNLKIRDILKATDGKLIIGKEEYECENFCRDTRIVQEKDTYIGIKGQNFDGNKLWKEAFENGADTVIIQENTFNEEELSRFLNKNIICVDDTLKALREIATAKRNLYGDKLLVVGVTGSVGKTSTKDVIANVLSQKYKTLKTEGNNNNDIGLPFTILNLKNHEAAVIEMGMNHTGEIDELTRIAKPTISVITNVGTSHIGNLGSRKNILNAKLEILNGMKEKQVIINNDNDLLYKWNIENTDTDIDIYTFGIQNKSDILAKKICLKEENSNFLCALEGEDVEINVPVGGIHFVYNAICAALVGKILGLNAQEIKNGIESFRLTKKRMDVLELYNNIRIINGSYNASFESMESSLRYLTEFKANRKIAVLGDMLELGDFSEELHRKVGSEVYKDKIDILICSGEKSRFIAEQAKNDGMNEEKIYILNKADIVKQLKNIISENDIILFKASNGMRFFDLVDQLEKEIGNNE